DEVALDDGPGRAGAYVDAAAAVAGDEVAGVIADEAGGGAADGGADGVDLQENAVAAVAAEEADVVGLDDGTDGAGPDADAVAGVEVDLFAVAEVRAADQGVRGPVDVDALAGGQPERAAARRRAQGAALDHVAAGPALHDDVDVRVRRDGAGIDQ